MKKFSVDRIEEEFAVCECEDLSHISVPLRNIPFEVKEGMIITLGDDGEYSRDEDEEALMRKKILSLQHKIFESDED